MSQINEILDNIKLPQIMKVSQIFDDTKLENVEKYLNQKLIDKNIKDKIKQVLILRFIELKKRREISDILHYSLSYIDRLLKRGLFFIDEKLKSSRQKVVI